MDISVMVVAIWNAPSFRTHMQDLKDYTQDVHYENFRKKKLLQASPG